jgi:hypothetical protein
MRPWVIIIPFAQTHIPSSMFSPKTSSSRMNEEEHAENPDDRTLRTHELRVKHEYIYEQSAAAPVKHVVQRKNKPPPSKITEQIVVSNRRMTWYQSAATNAGERVISGRK